MQLDRADKRLLRAVQADCTTGAENLAEQCGMSTSTVLRRLKKLRAAGVITAEVAVVDPRKLGRALLFIVGVRLERDNAAVVEGFVRRMRACPAVMQFYFVTGSADYILHISARDMDEFNAFMQEMLVSDPHVAMSETNVVISPLKMGLSVPIED